MADTYGRAAWRIWAAPLLTVLIMMAATAWHDENTLVKPTAAQFVLILTGAIALLFRLWWPVPVAAVTVVCGALLPLFEPHLVFIDVACVVAAYTVATLRSRRTAWTTGILATVALTAAIIPWQPHGLLDILNVLPANYILVAVAVGDAVKTRQALLTQVRERAEQAERTREQEARRRVGEERIRIARDLHDVVAHHITLVNAQAGVAHHLMRTHPDRAYQALAEIRETSRAALDELRATVGLLRQDDDPPDSRRPTPTFADVDSLIDGFRKAGADIAVSTEGKPVPLTAPADVAAYRLVQEALTNAGKHALPGPVQLHFAYDPAHLRITVTNPARPGHHGPGTGHGLIGMRERAEAADGTLTTEMRPDGRFIVEATLPLRTPAPGRP
ncbi:sensor histidine kinase [Actinoplanes sp. NPDC000266]